MGVFEWLVLGCCALGALASPALIIWATVIADESVGAARGVLFRLGLLGMLIATPAAIAAFGILLKTFRTSPPPPDQ